MKNTKPATVLNALKIKKVEIQSFRNGLEAKASLKPLIICATLSPMALNVRGEKFSFFVDLLGMNIAGIIAHTEKITATQMDN